MGKWSEFKSGNIAPQYRAIAFVLPVPVQLKKAWDYRKAYGLGDDSVVLSLLSSWLSEYIREAIVQGDDKAVLQSVPAMMGMGVKAVGSVAGSPIANDLERQDPRTRATLIRRVQMGLSNCVGSYELMKKSQEVRPDERKARYIDENADLIKYLGSIGEEVLK